MRRGKLDLTKLTKEELAALAANGDKAAFSYLWELVIPSVYQVVRRFGRSSRWVSERQDDIAQGVLEKYPVWIKRFRWQKLNGGTFDRWLYCTVSRVTQDVLRAQKDSLGIRIPQKQEYPVWEYLSHFDPRDAEAIVISGMDLLDRQIELNFDKQGSPAFWVRLDGISENIEENST